MRRLLINIASLLTSDTLNRATTFVVYALVARYLGDFGFGQISLALLLHYTFYVFASLGMRLYITREVARDLSRTNSYLINASALIVVTSLLSLAALGVFVWAMGYEPTTAMLVLIIGTAVLPYALTTVNEAIFQAWEKMQLIAYANIPHNILKVVVTVWLLHTGSGVIALGIGLVACYFLTLVLAWFFTLRLVGRIQWQIDLGFIRAMMIDVLPFLGFQSVLAIWSSLNVVILSRFGDEVDVGYFNAAMQLLVPVNLVIQSIVFSLYPRMVREVEQRSTDLQRVYADLIELLLIITVPAVVGLMLLAEPLLLLFYGNESFASATLVLQIVAWSLIPLALNQALGQVLLATFQERTTLRIVIVNTIISLILGVILIQMYGVVGAAIATLATRLVNLMQQYAPVQRVLGSVVVLQGAWRAVLASAGMAAVLLASSAYLGLWGSIAVGAGVYAVLLIVLMLVSHGGMAQLQEHYAYLRTRKESAEASGHVA